MKKFEITYACSVSHKVTRLIEAADRSEAADTADRDEALDEVFDGLPYLDDGMQWDIEVDDIEEQP